MNTHTKIGGSTEPPIFFYFLANPREISRFRDIHNGLVFPCFEGWTSPFFALDHMFDHLASFSPYFRPKNTKRDAIASPYRHIGLATADTNRTLALGFDFNLNLSHFRTPTFTKDSVLLKILLHWITPCVRIIPQEHCSVKTICKILIFPNIRNNSLRLNTLIIFLNKS